MIVDLQLCCALSGMNRLRILQGVNGCFRVLSLLLSPQLALAHVYGVEDPLCELLQLVRGVLGLLLQPQVVLPQVFNFCLQVGFVFFFLKETPSTRGLGVRTYHACIPPTQLSEVHVIRVPTTHPALRRSSSGSLRVVPFHSPVY